MITIAAMAKPLSQLAGLHKVEISKAFLTMNVNEIDPRNFLEGCKIHLSQIHFCNSIILDYVLTAHLQTTCVTFQMISPSPHPPTKIFITP